MMNFKISGKKIVIFGGTGFVGSHLVNMLCKNSCQIDIITRSNRKKLDFFLGNEPGQVKLLKIERFSAEEIDKFLKNADIVFNLIGILYETKNNTFNDVHFKIPKELASSAKRNKVRNFVHLSALNIEKAKNSNYAISKLQGENAVKELLPSSIIVRPSVVFGKRDGFTNLFYKMSNLSPILPIIGTPEITKKGFIPVVDFSKKVKFQPLYVGDLVSFLISVCLIKKKTYEIAGPTIQSFDQIFDIILSVKNRKRIYLPIPFFLAKIMALFFELLPKPPLTRDQIRLLKVDSISNKGYSNLKQYVKNPSSLKSIVETYI